MPSAAEFCRSFITRIASSVDTDAPEDLWDQVARWCTSFAKGALLNWTEQVVRDEECSHSRCERVAVSCCPACDLAVCLNHAFVNKKAEVICTDCVNAIVTAAEEDDGDQEEEKEEDDDEDLRRPQARRGAPPPPSRADTHPHAELFKILKVTSDADEAGVNAAFRAFASKKHPDRGGSGIHFAKVSALYEVYKRDEKRAA